MVRSPYQMYIFCFLHTRRGLTAYLFTLDVRVASAMGRPQIE